MRLAVNFSPQADGLLRSSAVHFDCYKCPPWPELIDAAMAIRPVYVHLPLDAGNGSLKKADWAAIDAILEQTDTPYVNLHLSAHTGEVADVAVDAVDPASLRRVIDRLIADVALAVSQYGAHRVIVENVIYRDAGGSVLRAAVDPRVITAVVRETGCGLLLDTAHARLSAAGMEMDVRDYVGALPLERLCELHVTGTRLHQGRMRDHMPMSEDDWEVAQWVMERIHLGQCAAPWAVALEYGGVGPKFEWRSEEAVLAADLPRLRTLIAAPS